MITKGSPLPLEGVRVLDLSHVLAGPFCAAILADYGAEVIKLEPPGRGERSRNILPFIERDGRRVGGLFATLSRNRLGIVLDLKSPAGQQACKELVSLCDVLLENFSPGTMDRLGLGYKSLRSMNPSLIYVAISGFGQLPPYLGDYTYWQANNATAQAMSGLMELSGDPEGPPALIGATMGDSIPGLWAVIATLVALEHRRLTGQGQFVDVPMYDSLVAMCFKAITDYHVTGVPPSRGSEGWYTTFTTRLKCRDGYIAVSLWGGDPARWEQLWRHIRREDMLSHPDFSPIHPGRPQSFKVVKQALEEWLQGVDRWEAVRALIDMGFSAGPVQNAKEVYECPQLRARQLFVEMEDGIGGKIRTVATPVKFSGFSPRPPRRAPYQGEHTVKILTDLLGYTPTQARLVTGRAEG